MNLTNDSSENDNDNNSSSDEDEDNENTYSNSSTILMEKYFSTDKNQLICSDDDDDDGSDIENDYSHHNSISKQNRLCTLLRQSNRFVELKLNVLNNCVITDNEMSKQNHQQGNNFIFSSIRFRRLYLPSSYIEKLQTQITNWLEASRTLIDSFSTSTYHRRCWSQLLLTYFIEQRFVNLQFILCTHSLTRIDQESCSIDQHSCVPEEDACKLSSILQKGSKFNIDSNIFDHIRRIIIIKSMQEVFNDNTNLQQLYLKQLTSLKQCLIHQQSNITNRINVASIYSKLLLFLSSLYSIKAETMQILFCRHLLHNPMYSFLVNS